MAVREIHTDDITKAVRDLVIEACCVLPDDVYNALSRAFEEENAPAAKGALSDILENARLAKADRIPICQDTGLAVFFLEVGQDVHITGGTLQDAMDKGVARGYTEGYLRKSTQDHALTERVNRGNNTPAICHIRLVPGDQLKITVCPKGGGSENMSRVGMLKPAAGRDGIIRFVVDTVKEAGPNPCPPVIVGVGIGGTFEKAALLAKESLCRETGKKNEDPEAAALEEELLEKINKLGIGSAGYGGSVTALAVHVLTHPVHLASLPVAVNIQCHAARHKTVVL